MAAFLRSRVFQIASSAKYSVRFGALSNSRVVLCPAVNAQETAVCDAITTNIRALVTQSAAAAVDQQHYKLDRALYRLDQDVRRVGRIQRRELDDIFAEIKSLGKATSTQSLLVIRCCGTVLPEELPENRITLVQEIWKTLNDFGVSLDISHHNALLKVYLENEHAFSPSDFLATLEQKKLAPNRVTYQRLITRYCQTGDIDGAGKILEFMKKEGMPINENVFNSLIIGHAKAKDIESAKGILDVMRSAKLEPGPETYKTLASMHASAGDLTAINETIAEAEKNDIYLLDSDYLDIIQTLAANGHSQHVDEVIKRLRKHTGYTQDAYNIILSLIGLNQSDVAFKVLLTMPRTATTEDGEKMPVGQFFIRQLVRTGQSADAILKYCEQLKTHDLSSVAVLKALESALFFEKTENAKVFMKKLHSDSVPLRPHYFWPMLASYNKVGNREGVWDTMRLMQALDVTPNFDTLFEYVFPALSLDDPFIIVEEFKRLGMTVGAVTNPLVSYLVSLGNTALGASVLQKYTARLTPSPLVRLLSANYHEKKDAKSVVAILSRVRDLPDRQNKTTSDWGGQMLLDYLVVSENSVTGLVKLLREFKAQQLPISITTADLIHKTLKQSVTEEIASLLESLSTSSVGLPSERHDDGFGIPHPKDMSIEELESHLIELRSKNMGIRGVLRKLFLLHCRFRNLDRVLEIKKELDTVGFIYSSAMKAALMDTYSSNDKLEEALETQKSLMESFPDFVLDDYKILNLATLLVQKDRIDEAVTMLTEHCKKSDRRDRADFIERNVFRLLNAAAEKGDVVGTKRLWELGKALGLIPEKPSNHLAGPLIKVHLKRDDLASAITEYENCCRDYKVTPWKGELFNKLIVSEDADRLQKLVDLTTEIHGEMNTMFDLAISFIESGRPRQAKKILDTPGLRANRNRLDMLCDRFVNSDRVAELESLITVTKDVFDVDRDHMYLHLLKAYRKAGDYRKGLGVWESIQEEDFQPSDKILIYLSEFLKEHNQPVPFEAPVKYESITQLGDKLMRTIKESDSTDDVRTAIASLEERGVDLTYEQKLKLLDHYANKGELQDAVRILVDLQGQNTSMPVHLARFVLSRLSAAGDWQSIQTIGQGLSSDLMKRYSYTNYLYNAYIESGKADEVIGNLEKSVDSYSPDSFPMGAVLGLLLKKPEHVEHVTTICTDMANKGALLPANAVWLYYMSVSQFDKADEILKIYPAIKDQLLFRAVTRTIRMTDDAVLAEKLCSVVTETNLAKRMKGVAYSSWIDVLCNMREFDKALTVYNNSEKAAGLQTEHYQRSSLFRLKDGLQLQGRSVPFFIDHPSGQPKKTPRDGSDSSSDDEDIIKK